MKIYEYRVITVWNQSMVNDFEFNELGKEGFRVVSHVTIPGLAMVEGELLPPPQCEQFLMEKETIKEGFKKHN